MTEIEFCRISDRLGTEFPYADFEVKFSLPTLDTLLYPPAELAVRSATVDDQAFAATFTQPTSRTVADTFVAVLRNAVVMRNGFVLDSAGRLVIESLYPWDTGNFVEAHRTTVERIRNGIDRGELKHLDRGVHFRSPAEPGYFHWIQSVLPRLELIKRCTSFDALPYLINDSAKFMRDTLAWTAIESSQVIKREEYVVEELVFPSPFQYKGDHFHRPPAANQLIRSLFSGLEPKLDGPKRIFVSREDASIRRLTNEAAIVADLEKLGFTAVTLSGMTLTDQVALFRGAEIVVGPHGAGLANIVFMEPDTKVVEVISPQRVWPTFKCIANRGSMRYSVIAASDFDSTQTAEQGVGNEDILADSRLNADLVASIIAM